MSFSLLSTVSRLPSVVQRDSKAFVKIPDSQSFALMSTPPILSGISSAGAADHAAEGSPMTDAAAAARSDLRDAQGASCNSHGGTSVPKRGDRFLQEVDSLRPTPTPLAASIDCTSKARTRHYFHPTAGAPRTLQSNLTQRKSTDDINTNNYKPGDDAKASWWGRSRQKRQSPG